MINGYSIRPYCLTFKRPWKSHHGQQTQRHGFLVELTDSDGNRSIGDSAPFPELGTETLSQCHQQLLTLEESFDHISTEALLSRLQPLRTDYPALCCGMESAILSLISRQQQCTPAQWLNPNASDRVRVNQIVSDLTRPEIDPTGSSIIKVKLGIRPFEIELKQIQQLSSILLPQQQLRLDPNGAWCFEEAHWFIQQLDGLPIESIEEPLHHPTLTAIQQLQQLTPIPIVLDESLQKIGMDALLHSPQPIQRAVLKPTLLGGPLTTSTIAQQLQQHGVETIITSTLESAIGVTLTAHCAAAVDHQQQLVHGLDTCRLFTTDLALAPTIKNGILHLP